MLTLKLAAHLGAAGYVGYGALANVEGASSGTSLESFLQYGVLGLVVVGFLTGWIVPGPTAKQMLGENTRLQTLVEKVIPMTATYASTMEKSTAALDRAAQVMEAMAIKQSELEKRVGDLEGQR